MPASPTITLTTAVLDRLVTAVPTVTTHNDTLVALSIDWGDGAVEWMTDDGAVTHDYADDGGYTLTASVTDDVGAVALTSARVWLDLPAPTVTVHIGAIGGSTVAATVTTSREVPRLLIDWGDGMREPAVSGDPVMHTYEHGTLSVVRAHLTDTVGRAAESAGVLLCVPVSGDGAFAVAFDPLLPARITVRAADADHLGDPTTSWRVTNGAGWTAGVVGEELVYTLRDADSQLDVEVSTANTAVRNGVLLAANAVPPVASVTVAEIFGQTATLCPLLDDVAGASAGAIIEWGDGTYEVASITDGRAAITHTYAAAGRYWARLIATDGAGTQWPGAPVEITVPQTRGVTYREGRARENLTPTLRLTNTTDPR